MIAKSGRLCRLQIKSSVQLFLMKTQELVAKIRIFVGSLYHRAYMRFETISTPRKQQLYIIAILSILIAILLFSVRDTTEKQKQRSTYSTDQFEQPSARDHLTIERNTEDCQTLTNSSQKDFEFTSEHTITDTLEQEKIHLAFADIAYLNKKLNPSDEILLASYLNSRNQVIYLTGYDDLFKHKKHLRKINLLDLSNNSIKTLFSYETVLKEDQGAEMYLDLANIRSFSVNAQQNKIAIITDKEIFVYDLDQEKFIFSHNGKFDGNVMRDVKNDRHFFNALTFSPDDTQAILSYSFYEGVSYFLLNFETKEIIDLNKGGHGGGSFIQGWYNDRILFIKTSDEEINLPRLCTETINSKQQQCIVLSTEEWAVRVRVINDKIFTLSRRDDTNQKSVACNNIGSKYEFSHQYDTIMQYSFIDQSEKEILHKDTTQVSGFILNSKILDFIEYNLAGTPGLLVQLRLEDESIVYGFLNPEVPEKLTRVVF